MLDSGRRTIARVAIDSAAARYRSIKTRRQAQDVADIVEAVPDIIGREVIGGPKIDPDQVPDGVVIFGPIRADGS